MTSPCAVCASISAKYICPRCNARYCSLDCYKNHSTQCTDTFYRETAAEELHTLTASDEEKRGMEAILRRLHEQQLDEEGSVSEEEEEDEELVAGLPLKKAILLAQGVISLEDLTSEELSAMQREMNSSAAIAAALQMEAWQPWWFTEAAADLELSSTGTHLIEEVGNRGNRTDDDGGGGGLPPPPPTALPSLSVLSSKPASPAVALHFLDLLYSYCLVLRLFNGQWSSDVLDAADTLLAASSVLSSSSVNSSTKSSTSSSTTTTALQPSEVLLECVVRVCGADAGRAHVPRGFAVGVVSDVAKILSLGRSVAVTALMDLSRIVDAGLTEARASAATTAGEACTPSSSKQRKEVAVQLKQAKKKMLYFISWANESVAVVGPSLAMAATAVYEQERATLVDVVGDDESETLRIVK